MKLTVAFDVDDCLVKWTAKGPLPDHNVIDLLRWFVRNKHKVVLWSGSGIDYAERFAENLNLDGVTVIEKAAFVADIAVDDSAVGAEGRLGRVIILV